MKNSAKGNMYEVALNEAWDLFAAHLGGARAALVCVVSQEPLDERARAALNSSVDALGYGRDGCTFISLQADDGSLLDDQALFLLVEGLDPSCLIACDQVTATALGKAFRCEVLPMKQSRVFGRTAVAFRNFTAMLDDGQDKQVAWALLKKLPKFGRH